MKLHMKARFHLQIIGGIKSGSLRALKRSSVWRRRASAESKVLFFQIPVYHLAFIFKEAASRFL